MMLRMDELRREVQTACNLCTRHACVCCRTACPCVRVSVCSSVSARLAVYISGCQSLRTSARLRLSLSVSVRLSHRIYPSLPDLVNVRLCPSLIRLCPSVRFSLCKEGVNQDTAVRGHVLVLTACQCPTTRLPATVTSLRRVSVSSRWRSFSRRSHLLASGDSRLRIPTSLLS